MSHLMCFTIILMMIVGVYRYHPPCNFVVFVETIWGKNNKKECLNFMHNVISEPELFNNKEIRTWAHDAPLLPVL